MNYSNSPNNMYFLSLVINNFIAKLLNFIHEWCHWIYTDQMKTVITLSKNCVNIYLLSNFCGVYELVEIP